MSDGIAIIVYAMTAAQKTAFSLDPLVIQQAARALKAKRPRYQGLTIGQASRIDRTHRQAARLTSAQRPVRRLAPTRRSGSVVARHRTAGKGKPASGGGDDPGQSDEPSGLAARPPRAMSAPHHVPAIAAGTSSCPKEATR
jgi:hypothetical protein